MAYLVFFSPVFAFSEIDDVASVEAQTKGEYKKIDKDFYLKGIRVLDRLEFKEEDKDLAKEIYDDFEKEYYLRALSKIDNLSDSEQKDIFKAIIYASLNMMNTAENILKNIDNPILDAYKGSLNRENKYQLLPFYGLLSQNLSDEYDLDYQKWGVNSTKNINDAKIKMDYKMINYSNSNHFFDDCLANYIRVSYDKHESPKIEYSASIGGKFFENNGKPLLIGDIWGKYHFNDNVNIKYGLSREAVEQSYITAVGDFVGGEFTGRAANNKAFIDLNYRSKKEYYASIRAGTGFINGYNLSDNFGYSIYLNLGKRLYNNPHNLYIQKIDFDLTSYNMGYSKDLLSLYNPNGGTVGGYFSPKYYNATAANIRFEGEYKKLNYGLKGFIGEQISTDNNVMSPTFGVSPYVRLKINNRLYFKITYTLAEFADIKSNLFSVGFLLRL